MKRFTAILLALVMVLTLCACNAKNIDKDKEKRAEASENVDETENEENNGNDMVNTCWHFICGQTNGCMYTAKFLEDGTIFAFTINGAIEKGIYEYSNGRLVVSFKEDRSNHGDTVTYIYNNVEFEKVGEEFKSVKEYEAMVGKINYVFSPIDSSLYDEYYNTYVIPQSNFAKQLMSGSWYSYTTQCSDCYEFVFRDDGTVWIRYRDFMTGNGEYDLSNETYGSYSIDDNNKCVYYTDSQGSNSWYYDKQNDVLYTETYDGPSDSNIIIYLVHYSETPSIDTINHDRAEYAR